MGRPARRVKLARRANANPTMQANRVGVGRWHAIRQRVGRIG
jgi:hypothetical protein